MKFILILLLIPLVALSKPTESRIDQINQETGTDIILNPTNDVKINTFTGSKALQSGALKEVQESSVTNTELGYVSGVTSSIQTQINGKQDDVLTTNGDILYYNSGSVQRLAIGTINQLLTIVGGLPIWQDPPVSTTLDTKGQIQGFSTVNANVGPCTDDQILVYDVAESTGWKCDSPPAQTPTTTEGDLIFRGASEDERLGIGSVDQLLTVVGGIPVWADAPISTTLTTKGDLQGYSTQNARVPVGLDGEFLVSDSTNANGVAWSGSIAGTLNPITDQTNCPAGTTFSWGTGVAVTCTYSRVGETAKIKLVAEVVGAIGSPSNAASFTLTSGLSIDWNKLNPSDIAIVFRGNGLLLDSGSQSINLTPEITNDTQTIGLRLVAGTPIIGGTDYTYVKRTTSFDATNIFTATTGDFVTATFTVPIAGWSSGVDAAIQSANTTSEKAGFIIWSAADIAESDILKADGRCVLEADYPDYLENIGNDYGDCTISVASDGMRLPDLRGQFARVMDDMGTAAGDGGNDPDARTLGSTQADATAVNGLTADQGGHFHLDGYNPLVPTPNRYGTSVAASANTMSMSGSGTTAARSSTVDPPISVGGGGSETRPLNMALMAYVRMINLNTVVAGTFTAASMDETMQTKCQTKYLSADITSDTVGVSDLGFSSLTTGKDYQIIMNVASTFAGSLDTHVLRSKHDSSTACTNFQTGEGTESPSDSATCTFTATTTTLTHDATSIFAGDVIDGDGTVDRTFVTLCQLPDTHITTTEW